MHITATIAVVRKDGVENLRHKSPHVLDDFGPPVEKDEAEFWFGCGQEEILGLPLVISASEKCIRENGINMVNVICATDGSPLSVFANHDFETFVQEGKQFRFIAHDSLVTLQLFHDKNGGHKPDDYDAQICKLQIARKKNEYNPTKGFYYDLFLKKTLLWRGKTKTIPPRVSAYENAFKALIEKHHDEIKRGGILHKSYFYLHR